MNIKDVLIFGRNYLIEYKVEDAYIIAKELLEYVFKVEKEKIIIQENKEANSKEIDQYKSLLTKIANGIPVQYITNNQEFMKLSFYVDENVLIPQPDTEILVEEILKLYSNKECKILDLCTGSGAIAISLKKFVPNADITAVDISEKALEIAQKNAKKLETKINFLKSDLFDKLDNKKFDIIVSNPPYIRKDEIKKLSEEVQKEPKIALDGGEDGLDFYRIIAEQAINYLKTGSFLCFEIGYNQKNDVIKIIEDEQNYKNTYCKKDLYGNDRIIITQVL